MGALTPDPPPGASPMDPTAGTAPRLHSCPATLNDLSPICWCPAALSVEEQEQQSTPETSAVS